MDLGRLLVLNQVIVTVINYKVIVIIIVIVLVIVI